MMEKRTAIEHEIKIWPQYQNRIINGQKKFEVRKNDRDYQTGDLLILKSWNPDNQQYTGGFIKASILYVLNGPGFGIQEGYCVMSLDLLEHGWE